MDNDYTKKLENVIKQMLQPLKGIPLSLVISGISGHEIIPLNPNDEKDIKVLDKLKMVANTAGIEFNKNDIIRPRPNEIGNDIEGYVKNALRHHGYSADTPASRSGKKKSMGYPDVQFTDDYNRINYLECKTYNIENINTSQRSFYLSPSDDFKITRDAHHFVLSYEIFVSGRTGNKNIFKCRSWKILSIENLEVDVKYEFNSDNARLYAIDLILAEGKIDI